MRNYAFVSIAAIYVHFIKHLGLSIHDTDLMDLVFHVYGKMGNQRVMQNHFSLDIDLSLLQSLTHHPIENVALIWNA